MDCSADYQSKRRKIRANVKEHIRYISTTSASCAESDINGTFTSDEPDLGQSFEPVDSFDDGIERNVAFNSDVDISEIYESSILAENTIDSVSEHDYSELTFDQNIDAELEQFEEGNGFLDSDVEVSNDENSECSNSTSSLTFELGLWAVSFNIPAVAVSELLNILRIFHPSLPKDPRTLLKTPKETNVKVLEGDGLYFHFGIQHSLSMSKQLRDFLSSNLDVLTISLQVNIDGLPLFHSTSKQFWPILGRVCSPIELEPFVIGLYCGDKKPSNVQEYLQDFVDEVLSLQQGPTNLEGFCQSVIIQLSCFICDAPARAFVKQVKSHSGYYGCDKCTQKGIWDGRVIFPDVNCAPRTDVQFDEMIYSNHKIGSSPLQGLSLGMISQFPLDYMHLVCLGVTRRLLWYWLKSPVNIGVRLASQTIHQISENLLVLKNFIPREFSRKCRSLSEMDRWKATEFRQFLLYTGMVVLKGRLSHTQYKHFLLLFVPIFCLASPDLFVTHASYAHELLCIFVQQASELYGRCFLVYNVHCLSHIAEDVKRFGPLDSFSAFPFENYLSKLKRLVRKPQFPLQQVIRRLTEKSQLGFCLGEKNKPVDDVPKREHFSGPVPEDCICAHQFRQIYHKGVFFSTANGDNCIMMKGSYFLIRNIISSESNDSVKLVLERFLRISEFFKTPLRSSVLGIVMVSDLAGRLESALLSDIERKYVLFPYKSKFVLVPLSCYQY